MRDGVNIWPSASIQLTGITSSTKPVFTVGTVEADLLINQVIIHHIFHVVRDSDIHMTEDAYLGIDFLLKHDVSLDFGSVNIISFNENRSRRREPDTPHEEFDLNYPRDKVNNGQCIPHFNEVFKGHNPGYALSNDFNIPEENLNEKNNDLHIDEKLRNENENDNLDDDPNIRNMNFYTNNDLQNENIEFYIDQRLRKANDNFCLEDSLKNTNDLYDDTCSSKLVKLDGEHQISNVRINAFRSGSEPRFRNKPLELQENVIVERCHEILGDSDSHDCSLGHDLLKNYDSIVHCRLSKEDDEKKSLKGRNIEEIVEKKVVNSGLINPYAFCYANALFQALFYDILKVEHAHSDNG